MNDDQLSGFESDANENVRSQLPTENQPRLPAVRDDLMDLGDDAGAGLEDLGLDETITPFVRILQAQSPQVVEGGPEQVAGLRAGMLYDTATQEGYDALLKQGGAPDVGIETAICFREHGFGIWRPRDLDGGFRGMLPANDEYVSAALKRFGGSKFNLPRFKKDSGWTSRGKKVEPLRYGDEEVELIETINFYHLYAPRGQRLEAATARRAITRFTSTSLQVAQGVLSKLRNWQYKVAAPNEPGGFVMKPAQIWTYRWRLRTVPQVKGTNSWFNYRYDLEPADSKPTLDVKAMIARTDPLFQMGREFYELAKSGDVKVDESTASGREPGEDDVEPF
jgi:hypothetical protein